MLSGSCLPALGVCCRWLAQSARPRQQTPAPFASLSAACVCPPLGGRCLPLAATPHRPLAFSRPLRGHTYRRKPSFPLILLETTQTFFRGMPCHAVCRLCRPRPRPPAVCPLLGPPAAVCPLVPHPAVKDTNFFGKNTNFQRIFDRHINRV